MTGQPAATHGSLEAHGPTFGGRLAAAGALLVLLGVTFLQIYRIGGADAGAVKTFAYTQDQAYEQLVIGRELFEDARSQLGHYAGMTPLAASASPGWSLIMAGLLSIRGLSPEHGLSPDEVALVPLVVNLVAAALLVMIAGHLVGREVRSGFWMFVFLVGMGVLLALPALVLTGMEHLVHMVVMLLAVGVGIRSLETPDTPLVRITLAVLLAAAMVALRYESLAILLALVLWAWVQRRSGRGVFVFGAGVAVVVAFGAFLAGFGSSVVPNPLLVYAGTLLEGGWRDWPSSLLKHALENLRAGLLIWVLVGAGAVVLAAWRGRMHSPDPLDRRRVGWLFVFVFAGLAHLLIGPMQGAGLRTAAYLIPLGGVALAMAVGAAFNADRLRLLGATPVGVGPTERAAVLTGGTWHRGKGLVALLCLLPIGVAAAPQIRAFVTASQAARDGFVRGREAASFVRTYYADGPVATNQTGVLGYETRARLVDLSGTTDHHLALARRQGTYGSEQLARAAEQAGARIALILGASPSVPVPQDWVLIGGWHRAGSDRSSESAVTVYSVTAPAIETRSALRGFGAHTAEVEFWFVEDEASPATHPEGLQWSRGGHDARAGVCAG